MIYNFEVQKFLDQKSYYSDYFDTIEKFLYPDGEDVKFDYNENESGSYELNRILALTEKHHLNIIYDFEADLNLLGVDALLLTLKLSGEDLYILLVDQKLKISDICPDIEKAKARISIIGHEFAHFVAIFFEENPTPAISITRWDEYIFGNYPQEPINQDLFNEEKIDLWYLSIMFGPRKKFYELMKQWTKKENFLIDKDVCAVIEQKMTQYTIIPTEFIYFLYITGFINADYHFLKCDIDGLFTYSQQYIPNTYPAEDRNELGNCFQMMNNPETAIGKVVSNYFACNEELSVFVSSKLHSNFNCFARYYAFAYIKGLPHFVFCVGTIK